ncbi:MAG: FG-GAP repeat protein [Myxococcota bacterium]
MLVLSGEGWALAHDFDGIVHPRSDPSFTEDEALPLGSGELDGLPGEDVLLVKAETDGERNGFHIASLDDVLDGHPQTELVLRPAVAWRVSDFFQFADLDGDGITDLVTQVRPGPETESEAVAIWRGPLLTDQPDRPPDLVFRSPTDAPEHRFGGAIAVLDFDGDGQDELAVGSDLEGGPGAVYVYEDVLAGWHTQNPGFREYSASQAR